MMNRRDFLLHSLAGGSLLFLPRTGLTRSLMDFNPEELSMAPLERLSRFGGSSAIEGDTPDEAHEVFWDKDGFLRKKGGIPAPNSHYDVVIIGGGLAGLSSAHYLKGKKIIILEGHPRLGGNAKSQVIGNTYVAQGSAYITIPEAGDEIDTFLRDLNLRQKFREVEHDEEAVTLNGKIQKHFWEGSTAPEKAQEFKRALRKLQDIYENSYPELPCWDDSSSARAHFNQLDRMSFSAWIQRELGDSHPHIREFVNLYCWSSFSGGADEISAAQGLNFLSCDLAGTLVLPGGNGLIAEALYQDLRRRRNVTLESKAFAVDVRSEGGKASVCYHDRSGSLQSVTATDCIIAAPKLVAKKILHTLPASQKKAMDDISYRAYLVANIFLKKKVTSPGYDLFTMTGSVPADPYRESKERVFTDVVFSDWALRDRADKSVLTLYLPLPYAMAQQYLFYPGLYEKYQERIYEKLRPILAGLGLSLTDIEGMRLVRYGHSMPLARVGGVSSGTFERASESIDDCIHFANQDNWGNPCFETSLGVALRTSEKVLR